MAVSGIYRFPCPRLKNVVPEMTGPNKTGPVLTNRHAVPLRPTDYGFANGVPPSLPESLK
jgi:hypothetical protein